MIFNTFSYFLLFLAPAAVSFRLVKPGRQPWICIGFGAAFFIFFSLTQLGGIAGAACLAIFLWEAILSRFYKQDSLICLIGIAQTLVFLIIFKYWNFFTGLLFGPPAHNPLFWAGAFLPLGISFFTFEFIHYAVDRYRGATPAGKFSEYLAFILFFPTMVAGPIKRYQNFLPTLRSPSRLWTRDWDLGVTRILAGLAKKFVIADLLTAMTQHLNRADLAVASRWVLPVWLLAYGMKIYADFSAYSDIAIGSARLFGLRVPENFDWPYLQTDIGQFWRHWHISLYRWLVDYVFIPLGGSRCAPPRILVNLFLTMFLSGLWHGAGLHFVVWGLWHGMLLAVHRFWVAWRQGRRALVPRQGSFVILRGARVGRVTPCAPPLGFGGGQRSARPTITMSRNSLATVIAPSLPGKVLAWAITFVTVNLGWAFFCMDLPTCLFFFKRLFLG
jgi:alginate O-acetyltransferase complex protein AlgI